MPETKPFRPAKPEQVITVQITKREWNAIKMFRNLKYGSITLIRLDSSGTFRVEVKESIIIEEDMEIPTPKGVSLDYENSQKS